jgi:hypothetical protein
VTVPDTTDGKDELLHHLELRAPAAQRRSRPDHYDVDLLAQASWENPYRVRMQWSGEGRDPGALSWEFSTMHGALRHIHVLLTRQQGLGYTLTRIPRAHPYRAWLAAQDTDGEAPGEDDAQVRLF